MHEIMSFFFTLYTAYETMASWLSWMRPMNFLALRALKCRLTWLKTSSIGLNSHLYATLKMNRKFSSFITALARSDLWADKLSKNIHILSEPLAARRPCKYSINLSVFTEKSKIW